MTFCFRYMTTSETYDVLLFKKTSGFGGTFFPLLSKAIGENLSLLVKS